MRKIDYTTLALEINSDISRLKASRENTSDANALHSIDAQLSTLESLAYRLANRLHVDRDTFIHACFNGV